MCTTDEYLLAVLKILEIGADGRYTKEELDKEMEKQGIPSEVVHVYGSRGGLFEKTGSDEKQRLNRYGLELLLTHRSIKQAKRHALFAIGIAIIAMLLNVIPFLCT